MQGLLTPRTWGILAGLAIATLAGCGSKGDRPEIAAVTGTVTMNGTPLPNAQVAFEPESGRPSYGRTDSDGQYTLKYLHDVSGAKIGQHTVRISTHTMTVDPTTGAEKLHPETVPAQYNRDSGLAADVHEGGNEIHFELQAPMK